MDFKDLKELDSEESCIVVTCSQNRGFCLCDGFRLLVGTKVDRFQTPIFQPSCNSIHIQLKIWTRRKSGNRCIQFLQPKDDIIKVAINGKTVILTGGPDSFVYEVSYKDRWTGNQLGERYSFRVNSLSKWNPEYQNLGMEEANVRIEVGGEVIETRKELLVAESDVFRAMFEHETKERESGVIKIDDFSADVVREMIRFMMHGYCCLWYTKYDELNAIADKYNVKEMLELAHKKDILLKFLFPNE